MPPEPAPLHRHPSHSYSAHTSLLPWSLRVDPGAPKDYYQLCLRRPGRPRPNCFTIPYMVAKPSSIPFVGSLVLKSGSLCRQATGLTILAGGKHTGTEVPVSRDLYSLKDLELMAFGQNWLFGNRSQRRRPPRMRMQPRTPMADVKNPQEDRAFIPESGPSVPYF
jgi:hypothetical protein